jgi:hypothetical protein
MRQHKPTHHAPSSDHVPPLLPPPVRPQPVGNRKLLEDSPFDSCSSIADVKKCIAQLLDDTNDGLHPGTVLTAALRIQKFALDEPDKSIDAAKLLLKVVKNSYEFSPSIAVELLSVVSDLNKLEREVDSIVDQCITEIVTSASIQFNEIHKKQLLPLLVKAYARVVSDGSPLSETACSSLTEFVGDVLHNGDTYRYSWSELQLLAEAGEKFYYRSRPTSDKRTYFRLCQKLIDRVDWQDTIPNSVLPSLITLSTRALRVARGNNPDLHNSILERTSTAINESHDIAFTAEVMEAFGGYRLKTAPERVKGPAARLLHDCCKALDRRNDQLTWLQRASIISAFRRASEIPNFQDLHYKTYETILKKTLTPPFPSSSGREDTPTIVASVTKCIGSLSRIVKPNDEDGNLVEITKYAISSLKPEVFRLIENFSSSQLIELISGLRSFPFGKDCNGSKIVGAVLDQLEDKTWSVKDHRRASEALSILHVHNSIDNDLMKRLGTLTLRLPVFTRTDLYDTCGIINDLVLLEACLLQPKLRTTITNYIDFILSIDPESLSMPELHAAQRALAYAKIQQPATYDTLQKMPAYDSDLVSKSTTPNDRKEVFSLLSARLNTTFVTHARVGGFTIYNVSEELKIAVDFTDYSATDAVTQANRLKREEALTFLGYKVLNVAHEARSIIPVKRQVEALLVAYNEARTNQ